MKRIFCMLVIGVFVLGSAVVSLNGQTGKRTKAELQVLEVLKKFQAGYTARDASKLDAYVADIYDPEDCLVIGTGAEGPGAREWCAGIDQIKRLVKNDWEFWDDLKMNVAEARIRVVGKVAWVALWGTSSGKKDKKKEYDRVLAGISRIIERNKTDERPEMSLAVMLYVLNRVSFYLERYVPEGDEYKYPIRIAFVLEKKKGKWLIQLQNYSFPIKDLPIVRAYQ